MVPGRKYVLFEGIEDYIQPAFVYLKENDNPALRAFADFISSLRL